MLEAGYLPLESITPGFYWAEYVERKPRQQLVVEVIGRAPFMEIRDTRGGYPTPAECKFLCRLEAPSVLGAAASASGEAK